MTNGLTYAEVILGVLLPLVLGSFVYTWLGAKTAMEGLAKLRDEIATSAEKLAKETAELAIQVASLLEFRLNLLKVNDIAHLEERIARLEGKSSIPTP